MTRPALIRKLHNWELLHLREWAAQLEAENEDLRTQLYWTEGRAEMWQHAAE